MVDLPQPTILDYVFAIAIFLLTALPYLNSLDGNMVRARPQLPPPAGPCSLQPTFQRPSVSVGTPTSPPISPHTYQLHARGSLFSPLCTPAAVL